MVTMPVAGGAAFGVRVRSELAAVVLNV